MEAQLKKMLILKADEMLENMESQLKYFKNNSRHKTAD